MSFHASASCNSLFLLVANVRVFELHWELNMKASLFPLRLTMARLQQLHEG